MKGDDGMTAKRFRVNDLVKYNYSEIGEYIDENHTDRPLRNDILVKLLNDLSEENEQLKKENNKLHQKIFEMRTNVALDRTEISRQSYTPKEFLDKIEKW